MQVNKGTWHIRKQCAPGNISWDGSNSSIFPCVAIAFRLVAEYVAVCFRSHRAHFTSSPNMRCTAYKRPPASAFCNVRSGSTSNCRWVLPLAIPHTNWLRSMSSCVSDNGSHHCVQINTAATLQAAYPVWLFLRITTTCNLSIIWLVRERFPESFVHVQTVDTRPPFPPPTWPG